MPITKVIRDAEEAASRWELPEVDAPAGAPAPRKPGPTVQELEALQKQAYEEGLAEGRKAGFEQGLEEGRQAGDKQARELAQRVRAVFDSLSTPLAELDDAVEEQLVAMVLQLAQQLIRRELTAQPGEVMAVVREAVGLLPLNSRDVKVQLHPEDARFLREAWGQSEEASAWKLVEDPNIARGGCRVVTPSSRVDATLERRLAMLASELLGGSRGEDA